MNFTFRSALIGAAAVLALATSGCKREEKKDPADAPGAGFSGAEGRKTPLPAKTGFAVFPATSKMIAAVNLQSARTSALWGTYKDQIEAAMAKGMADFKTACGFDPFMQLQSVMMGGDPTTEEIVVVTKGLGRDQLKLCGEKMAAKEGKKLAITDEGNVSKYEVDNESVWGAWLDETTAVFAPKKPKEFVVQRAAGEAGLAEGADVMGLLKNVNTGATLYFAGTAEAMGANPAAAMMPGAKGLFASINLTDGLAFDAGVRFDTPENAKNFTGMMQQQIAAAKGQQMPPQMAGLVHVVEKAVIKQNGNDALLQLNLTAAELQQLATSVQQMARAFAGSGAGAAAGSSPN